jgi:agmatinase
MKYLGIENNFLAIEDQYSNLQNSEIAILPVPYEHSTSYGKGTALGPEAILKASAYVEFYDDEFDKEVCFENGICTLEPLNLNNIYDETALNLIQNNVEKLIAMNKFVVTLGGEHTISIATIAAHYFKYPEMSVLHFDAHSDLRQSYEDSIYSHACFMARVIEFFPPEKITQVGIRALCKEEANLINEKEINTLFASSIRRGIYGTNWQKNIVQSLSDEVYITFDVDYFDPSIMPSTGTPEPDGFYYSETLDVFREIKKAGKKIVGFDIVELAPKENLTHPDLTTARLLYKLLNFCF